jgi:hypothetical protein
MINWIRYFLTPGQNNSWDGGYLVWYGLMAEFIWKTATAPVFDFLAFGSGAAGLLAAGAALQWRANHDKE